MLLPADLIKIKLLKLHHGGEEILVAQLVDIVEVLSLPAMWTFSSSIHFSTKGFLIF